MGDSTKRVPVPAGGAPVPAALEAAEAAPPSAGTSDATSPDEEAELVEARVLVAFGGHDANDLIRAPAGQVERMRVAGQVDPHPDAVAHVKRG